MQRYSLTRSGVCDCMLKDDNGSWVMFKEADQAIASAQREGWEQGKKEAAEIANHYSVRDDIALDIIDDITAMEYKEQS